MQEEMELVLKSNQIIMILLWMTATMSTIAAVNSVMIWPIGRAVVFLVTGLFSLALYSRQFKK